MVQILAVIAFNLIAALLPAKGKFVADEVELQERPAGPLQDPTISILQPRKFFGISGFGFSKANVRQCNSLCPFLLGMNRLVLSHTPSHATCCSL